MWVPVSVCLRAILIPEYLDFHSSYSAPRSRIARTYSGMYAYSGISQTNAPLEQNVSGLTFCNGNPDLHQFVWYQVSVFHLSIIMATQFLSFLHLFVFKLCIISFCRQYTAARNWRINNDIDNILKKEVSPSQLCSSTWHLCHLFTIGHFRKITIILFVCSPKFCISIVFVFSFDHFKSQETLETMLMQNLGEQTKSIMAFSKVAYGNLTLAICLTPNCSVSQGRDATVISFKTNPSFY